MRYTKIIAVLLLLPLASLYAEVQSSIPIIRIAYNPASLSRDTFCAAQFSFNDGSQVMSFHAKVRHRGATAAGFKKKSYAVKLYDESGQKLDTSFMGMRSDNYWILDAMAIDKARMRNRVAMDLWLDFSSKPYYASQEPKMCNGYRGKFVEVFVNNEYNGLYCLMERVDRKQLKLKKFKNDTINGQLFKSLNWKGWTTEGVFKITEPYDNTSATWMRYEYNYPEVETNLINWKPLYDAVYFAKNSKDPEFAAQAESRYDIPVFIDYFLFTMILSARDNCGKNLFLSYYNIRQNSKLLVTPWDLELSFGRQFDGPAEEPEAKWMWKGLLFQRLEDTFQYYTLLRKRYAYLRSNFFSADALKQRFTDYFDLFEQTGAGERETEKWNGADQISLDFNAEEQFIYSWIDERLVYTDDLLDYVYYQSIANTPAEVAPTSSKILHNGQIYILRGDKVYTITGQVVR